MDLVTFVVISLIISATAFVLSELLRPKPKFENARPAGLGDFRFPTAIEGRIVPLIWGTVKISGPNVIWWGDLRQTPIRKKVRTSLFSSKHITTAFRYNVGIQMGICRGPIDALTGIWIGETRVFSGSTTSLVSISKPTLFGGDDFGSGGVEGTLRIHKGDEVQAANSYLQTFQNPTVPHRGTCYVVWEGGYIGNSTSIKPWAFEVQRFPNRLGLASSGHIVNGFDANPAEVIYEMFVDGDWGFGFLASDIDLANFQAAGNTLKTEGNGFSLLLDHSREASDLLHELERQMDGLVYLDHTTGKFKIALARGGYDVNLIPQVDSTNIEQLKDFTRGTWDETMNQVRVQFNDRDRGYFETFAQAHDLANQRIQGGEIVSSTITYPGVKTKALANRLASRALRNLSAPLAKANLVVDRSMYGLKPGDVVAWTDANLGITKLAMRVIKIDFGAMLDGRIELGLVQDVFQFASAFFGDPDNSLWTAPNQNVDPFPAAQQRAVEAPWALVRRDPLSPDVGDRIFAAGRAQTGAETSFRIFQRNAAGTPSGSFVESGEVVGFCPIGQLRTAITAGTANPATTVSINGTPDTLATLQAALVSPADAGDVGQNLLNLIFVDEEFMACTSVVNQGTHLDLTTVYRGMLDTVPAAHAINANVFLVAAGSGLSDSTIPPTNNVDIKLRPRSRTDEVLDAEATTIAFLMKNRVRRPYPPTQLKLNTVLYPTSVDFDTMRSGGTTLDDRGIDSAYTRRDYRTFDEVVGIGTDAGTLDPTFPSANSTVYKAKVTKDPSGTPVVLFETVYNSGTASIFLSRTKILRYNSGAKPASLRVEIFTRHSYGGTLYEALQNLLWDFSLAASTLDNDTNMGVLAQNVIGSVYTAPTTGTYTFNLGAALSTGNVDARINGGTFSTVIAAGNTTGTLAGVVANDTIEVRHTQGGAAGLETFLEVDAPSSTVDAYAILTY